MPACDGYTSKHIVCAHTYLPDIVDVWMVFWWSKEEFDSLSELDPTEGGVGQVEENSKDHRDWDQPQTLVGQGGQYCGEGGREGRREGERERGREGGRERERGREGEREREGGIAIS